MAKISAEDLLQAIGDPSFEENVAKLIIKNPELEQSLDLAIMRIKSKHELRNKIVLLMNEKSGSKIFDIDESFECKESPNDDSSCIKDDKSSYFSLIHFQIGNNVPCPLCEKWTNYSKYAKHAREKHEGKTTKEILDQKENLNIMYEMYQKEKQKE